MSPALSPDGSRVAFVWNGPNRDNYDIYVKIIGSVAAPERVTTAPEADLWPAWSPDGLRLAFVREGQVFLAAYGGEEERKLSQAKAGTIEWTSDGRWIAASSGGAGITLVRATDGGRRWVRNARRMEYGDLFFHLSKDRKRLVYTPFENEESADVFLIPDLEDATRQPRRLTSHNRPIYGLAWLEDQATVFYASGRDPFNTRLYRLAYDAMNNATVREVAEAGEHVAEPSATVAGSHIEVAYTRIKVNTDLWMWREGQGRKRVLEWDSEESSPQISPDGASLAFVSNRGGSEQLWVSRLDGRDARSVTAMEGARLTGARWSPDGKQIAFSAEQKGNRDVYLASIDGQTIRRLTQEPSEESRPGWSVDGAWVYFSSNRSGSPEIWRAGVDGSPAEQVTEGGGYEAVASPDGKALFFTRAQRQGLWRMDLETKKLTRLLYLVEPGYWGLADTGVFYVDLTRAEGVSLRMRLLEWAGWSVKPTNGIMFYDPSTRLVKRLDVIEEHFVRSRPGFSVSRDGKTVVWAQVAGAESDIMRVRLPLTGSRTLNQ